MDKAILDTDVMSEILKGRNAPIQRASQRNLAEHGRYTISTITVMEVVRGLHVVGREEGIEAFLREVGNAEVLTLSVASAETAGRIIAGLKKSGRPIGREDPIIAAIALEYGLPLVTGNVAHYGHIQARTIR